MLAPSPLRLDRPEKNIKKTWISWGISVRTTGDVGKYRKIEATMMTITRAPSQR
jgi:hypothetical protein